MRLVDIDDIRVMKFLSEEDDPSESDGEREYRNGWNDALTAINDIQPSAEPDDAALHESCTDCPLYDHDRHSCPRFNRVIPTAILEAQQHWIPVTERLPEAECGESESVLVCFENGTQDVLYFNGGNWCYPTGETYISRNYKNGWHNEVAAWMPLPEPLEGEANED